MPAPHLIVAGAGIGGLTAAIALARRGFDTTVVEKRTGFGETGAGLQLAPNAGRVLDDLGLTLALKRAAVTPQRLTVRRWRSGKILQTMAMEPPAGETPFRALARPDLHTILLDAARSLPNIRLIVGRGLAGVEQNDARVRVRLLSESGTDETLEAVALIGADGLWSRTRELVADMSSPQFTGYEAWRAMVPRAAKGDVAEVSLTLGPRRHAVHYPVAGGALTNLVVIRQAREAREGWSRDGDASVVAADIACAHPALRDLAQAAPGWQVWSLYDRKPARMAQGRIALLGDAAHPILPFLAQGAALAIEDAAVLARELAGHIEQGGAAAVPAALEAYAAARESRVARVQRVSRDNGRIYHLAPPWSLARDIAMKRMAPEQMRRRYDWLYDWRA